MEAQHWGGQSGSAPAIVAASAVNGLAPTPYQTWAFQRAEVAPFIGTPFRCHNGLRATMAPVPTIDPKTTGGPRLVELALRGLSDVMETVRLFPAGRRVPVVVGFPRRMAGASPEDRRFIDDRKKIEGALYRAVEEAGFDPLVQVAPQGHASLAGAVISACSAVMQRTVELAVVGGVDSYYDPVVVERLLDAERLYDGELVNTLLPGEGASFLVIVRASTARQLRLPALCEIHGAATSEDPATAANDVPTLGLGLSRAANALSSRLRKERRTLDWWITDMTAEPLRVQELQLAWPRAARGAMPPEARLDILPQYLGDLGAAGMPTAVAVAIEGMRRGDPPARTCMITGSSDGPERAALLVASPEASR